MEKEGGPRLSYSGKVKLADGKEVEVITLWDAYKNQHLKDYASTRWPRSPGPTRG